MSSMEENFYRNHRDLITALAECLDSISGKLKTGAFISATVKEEAIRFLDQYEAAVKLFNKSSTGVFKRIQKKQSQRILNSQAQAELIDNKQAVEMLANIGREKLIRAENCSKALPGRFLVEHGYLEEIVNKETGEKFYVLSAIGLKCLKSKSIAAKLKGQIVDYSVPDSSLLELDAWGDLYSRRNLLLRDYFDKVRSSAHYFSFTADGNKDLVLGCEVSDFIEVSYIFPAVFNLETKRKDIECIRGMLVSGLVDKILILITSELIKEELILDGLDPVRNRVDYLVVT